MSTNHQHNTCDIHKDHDDTLISEIVHHVPYAVFSVALGFVVLSFLDFFSFKNGGFVANREGAHLLFHSFHFLHIIFAVTGSLITFSRFSNNMVRGAITAVISSLFFCTLSDVILPYLSGRILGVSMHFHLCLASELHNVIPFLLIGLVNGLVMSRHSSNTKVFYSLGSHFSHILISSLASLFYLISEGFSNWCPQMGVIFIFLMIAVVVPCTFADIIVPVFFAKLKKENEKHKT